MTLRRLRRRQNSKSPRRNRCVLLFVLKHIGILNGGRLVQVGKPEDILLNPADDYVASFVGDVNRARVLKAKSVMVAKNDSHSGMQVAHKANVVRT